MTRHSAWVVLLVIVVSGAAPAASAAAQQRADAPKAEQKQPDAQKPQDPPRFKWWLQPEIKKDLRLSDKLSQKIDEIFEAFIPKQRERWHEIEKLDDGLAKMTADTTVDVTVFSQQVEKLEKLRAEERIARAVMIYRIRLLLNPEQRVKVDAIRARMDEDRRRQEEERRKRDRKDDKRDHAPQF